MEAIIVGAGMGGLSAALALHAKGIGARIFEAAREIRELGVGINVLPHATKELDRLCVLPAMVGQGVITREVVRFDHTGTRLTTDPRGTYGGYKWPQVSIHRGRFQRILYDAAVQRLGADRVHTDRRLTEIEDKGDRIVARFADHAGKTHEATADVLIAADGIHSRARRIFYPDEGAPAYSGIMMWRGTSRAKPFLTGASMVAVGHSLQKWIAYPITHPGVDGLCTINWLSELPRTEMLAPEEWNRPGKLADFHGEFTSWSYDWANPAEIMANADGIFEFPMVDRDPVPRWTFGRATLLGDAAHAMYPVGSNGSSQAILDAACIAETLAAHPSDPQQALRAYEARRLPATTKTVQAHRERQSETASDVAEMEANTEKFRKAVGFDVETVNKN
jgi:2-polyprenyl-6-methoxyphenol hydroxylase-like FAD-dependent oxidoreductase